VQSAPGARWFERPAGDSIFWLTKYPFNSDEYDDGTGWGRAAVFSQMYASNTLVPVTVGSGGAGDLVPREVRVTFSFYQVTKKKKRMIFSSVDFGRFCTSALTSPDVLLAYSRQTPPIGPCDLTDRNYTLQVSLTVCRFLQFIALVLHAHLLMLNLAQAMSYLELLNAFEFTFDVYGV
jgi:hypothetical protein